MKKIAGFLAASLIGTMPAMGLGNTANAADSAFTDISNDPFKSEITELASQGIIKGWPDGSFRPLEKIERQAMMAFFYRMAKSPNVDVPANGCFKDVPATHQFAKEICWAKQQRITTGWSDNTFRGAEPISRVAAAVMMSRFMEHFGANTFLHAATTGALDFRDLKGNDNSESFESRTLSLRGLGIINGWNDNTFRPQLPIDRNAAAAMLTRMQKHFDVEYYPIPADANYQKAASGYAETVRALFLYEVNRVRERMNMAPIKVDRELTRRAELWRSATEKLERGDEFVPQYQPALSAYRTKSELKTAGLPEEIMNWNMHEEYPIYRIAGETAPVNNLQSPSDDKHYKKNYLFAGERSEAVFIVKKTVDEALRGYQGDGVGPSYLFKPETRFIGIAVAGKVDYPTRTDAVTANSLHMVVFTNSSQLSNQKITYNPTEYRSLPGADVFDFERHMHSNPIR